MRVLVDRFGETQKNSGLSGLYKRAQKSMTYRSEGAGSACHSQDALQLIVSAWEEGLEAGISPDLMTFAALYAGLSDLVDARGEMQAALFMERLAVRVRDGEFSGSAPRQ